MCVRVTRQKPGGVPTVEIEYKNISIEADALIGSSQNPTVWNSVKDIVSKVVPKAGLQKQKVKLLDDVSGVIKPGRFTLVLGPPSCGKSILMRHLSGRLHLHKGLRAKGSIKYNGEDIKDFVVQRTAGLVDQYDNHIPNMKVLETINFAAECQIDDSTGAHLLSAVKQMKHLKKRRKGDEEAGDEANHVLENVSAALAETGSHGTGEMTLSGTDNPVLEAEFLDLLQSALINKAKPFITLHVLGLQNVADTFVGDESLRGVSGGEKKRVTTAEILVGSQWAIFMDEISTGLDSATTFSVSRSLRDACHTLRRTIVVSLLQPAPEVMELFDDLLLLTDGKLIYQYVIDQIFLLFMIAVKNYNLIQGSFDICFAVGR